MSQGLLLIDLDGKGNEEGKEEVGLKRCNLNMGCSDLRLASLSLHARLDSGVAVGAHAIHGFADGHVIKRREGQEDVIVDGVKGRNLLIKLQLVHLDVEFTTAQAKNDKGTEEEATKDGLSITVASVKRISSGSF